MSFHIIKQLNADAQEASAGEPAETAAITNVPVEVSETSEKSESELVHIEIKKPVEETIVTAHDDFDWSVDKRNVTSYTKDEKEKYHTVYDNTFKQINDGEMIKATVESLTKTDAVVNIGFKSDGLISLNEFRDMPGGVKVATSLK